MHKPAAEIVRIAIPYRLPIPTSDKDFRDCETLKQTIEKMHIISARLSDFLDQPAAIVQYAKGPPPAKHWGDWLWIKIMPDCQEFSWLGRLGAFIQDERTLIIVPRPGRLDESMADQARKLTVDRGLLKLVLGIVYPPHQCMRTFDFRQ